jgi:hypothetical protein
VVQTPGLALKKWYLTCGNAGAQFNADNAAEARDYEQRARAAGFDR